MFRTGPTSNKRYLTGLLGEWSDNLTYNASSMRLTDWEGRRIIDFDLFMKDFIGHNKIAIPSFEGQ